MEVKKSKVADLEKSRPTLLLIGLIVSFGVVLQSFEWSKINIAIKPVSSLEDENLYEPINEVMIVKPKPKVQESYKQPKRTKKGPVIVKDEPIKKDIEPKIIPKTKLTPNPSLKFDLNAKTPDTGEEFEKPIINNVIIPFVGVEVKPMFVGGEDAMIKFLSKNIKYPSIARDKGVQGTVYVSFIIDKEGNVTSVEIAKGLEKNLDKETLRVIKKMPKWSPGKQRGIPVKVKYTIPVNYTLKG